MLHDIADQSFRSKVAVTRYVKRGHGPETLLLLHGLGCSSLEWSENVGPLSRSMTVIAVDLIGFGASDKPAKFDYSSRGQARQLIALLDELGIERVHLVGNSFGGKVAIDIADMAGERVKSLTLVASAGAGKEAPLPMRISTLPFVGKLLPKPSYPEFRKGWQFVFVDAQKLSEERIRRKYHDAMQPDAQRSHLLTVRSMMNIWGFKRSDLQAMTNKVANIRCKTLIVWGCQDVLLPVAHAHVFKERIQGATLKLFEGCGHAPQIERSEEFNRLLEDFIHPR
jgi:4,5:9,10-diseco-3-hydroxy-5,9,17-trioxoandrosta-1(10),2-diene-4-oate hydrolase